MPLSHNSVREDRSNLVRRIHLALVWTYSITLFLSAGLLFVVQPMIGKMLLPVLGGTPAVWNTCMVFFQASLLLGYLYAHLTTRWLGETRQFLVHVFVLLLPLLILPISLRGSIQTLGGENPAYTLIGILVVSAGIPFFVVSISAPLLQKWFAVLDHPSAADPYFLYAASNAGSLIALLAYPLVIEPRLPLAEQSLTWRNGYIILIVLTCVSGLMQWRFQKSSAKGPAKGASGEAIREMDKPVNAQRRLRWVVYAFIPSSLMLGVTTYITTDIAALPLLWVVPLALYLLSFVFVFSRSEMRFRRVMSRILALVAIPVMIALIVEANYPHFVLIPEHLLLFFSAAMVCHGALAEDRPSTSHLTEYYLWMSLGGVLGGAFNALVAPSLFNGVFEYPLMIVLACAFRPSPEGLVADTGFRPRQWIVPLLIAPIAAGLVMLTRSWGLQVSLFGGFITFAVPAVLALSLADRPMRYVVGLTALWIGGAGYIGPHGKLVAVERNFFGVVSVTDDATASHRLMVHGNTVHGSESRDLQHRGEPLTYFHRQGPAGDVFRAYDSAPSRPVVGVVGLGAGSLASYARPGESWTFYEINPAVVRFARNPEYFSFVSNSRAGDLQVVLGDARLSLVNAVDGGYGLIVLDAFSSDAIPVHLVTREAVELYFRKLSPEGMIAFHITNRYLDLEPVLGRLALELGAVARTREDRDVGIAVGDTSGREPSQWLVMARSDENLLSIRGDKEWRPVRVNDDTPLWTDDFSNIVGVLRW